MVGGNTERVVDPLEFTGVGVIVDAAVVLSDTVAQQIGVGYGYPRGRRSRSVVQFKVQVLRVQDRRTAAGGDPKGSVGRCRPTAGLEGGCR